MNDDLTELRNIGWSLWDPIGLNTADGPPDGAEDEYDNYLLRVTGMLREGHGEDEAIDFLMKIESDYMALGQQPGARDRATKTVRAIRNLA